MFGFLNRVSDPVCGMKASDKSKYSSEYKKSRYYFCSEHCKKTFDSQPEQYATKKAVEEKNCCG